MYLVCDRHQQIGIDGMQQAHLAAALGSRAQSCGQQRLILAQETNPRRNTLFNVLTSADLHSKPRHARRGTRRLKNRIDANGNRCCPSRARAVSFASRCNSSSVLPGEARAPMAATAVVGLHLSQRRSCVLQRDGPVDFAPLAALFQHRPQQTIRRIQPFVGKPVAVRQPALVDFFVLERQNPHHLVVLDLHDQDLSRSNRAG